MLRANVPEEHQTIIVIEKQEQQARSKFEQTVVFELRSGEPSKTVPIRTSPIPVAIAGQLVLAEARTIKPDLSHGDSLVFHVAHGAQTNFPAVVVPRRDRRWYGVHAGSIDWSRSGQRGRETTVGKSKLERERERGRISRDERDGRKEGTMERRTKREEYRQ